MLICRLCWHRVMMVATAGAAATVVVVIIFVRLFALVGFIQRLLTLMLEYFTHL